MPSALADGDSAVRVLEVTAGAAALLAVLFPHLAGLEVSQVADCGDAVVIFASVGGALARCPRCGRESSRVHGRYQRLVADGAAGGRPLLIALSVRRFRCTDPLCAKATFAEQAEGLCARYLRRTLPLRETLARFGLELAGRAGARLAAGLGIPVHSSTVLRLVAALPGPPAAAAPRVTGVDDFALRKGRVYGTVVTDAETGQVIDLLPDREAATLEEWLKARPSPEVICRDRAGAYADGARQGAPGAVQVADRWHLWHNLAQHAARTAARHRECLREPAPEGEHGREQEPAREPEQEQQREQERGREQQRGEHAGARRVRERYEQVRVLRAQGTYLREIARLTGMSYGAAQRFARAAAAGKTADEVVAAAFGRRSALDDFKPYLLRRAAEGAGPRQLHAEIRAQGCTAGYPAIRHFLQTRTTRPARTASPRPRPAPGPPKTTEIAGWILRNPAALTSEEQASLDRARQRCPHLDALAGHAAAFAKLLTTRKGSLDDWISAVEADDQPDLRSFTAGIRRDYDAVANALTLPYSSGRVEGAVNKIKMIKRQMYGRASFDLLRRRVLHAN